jgi:hypothetical protein
MYLDGLTLDDVDRVIGVSRWLVRKALTVQGLLSGSVTISGRA